MRQTTVAVALFSAALAIAPAGSHAQSVQPGTSPAPAARPADQARPAQPATPATRRDDRTDTRAPDAPVAGANSFTEGQARSRIEAAGYANVSDLRKDDQGVWRGQAIRNGTRSDVALDYQGNVVAGVAARGRATSGTAAGGTTSWASPRQGTPGNPPSTATGRAVDRMQGETPRPDGTPGNPPGTAAGRAVDRATGSNSTGANPSGSAPVGTTGNTTR
jgi:hypothetical protein